MNQMIRNAKVVVLYGFNRMLVESCVCQIVNDDRCTLTVLLRFSMLERVKSGAEILVFCPIIILRSVSRKLVFPALL